MIDCGGSFADDDEPSQITISCAFIDFCRKFLSIVYSADGQHLLAAGDSKYICLYSVPDRLLVKRFELTINLSLEGVQEAYDRRRYLAAFGAEAAAASEDQRDVIPLPGVRSGDDHCRRWWRPDVRVASVSFAPTGKSSIILNLTS